MEQKVGQQKYFICLKKSIKDWKFWAKLLIGWTQILSIVTFLIISTVVDGELYAVPEQLSYFTTLSNIFCAIFFIYSAVFHHMEGKGKFDNSEVAKIAITYITLTILIYNLNQLMEKNSYIFDSWKYTMSFICEHSLVPILAVIYYLFFYNHENTKDIKEFSKKWVWYMIIGLVVYLTFFSIMGQLARILNWKQLFGTIDGSKERSTFVYPFMDWYHGVGFFKHLSSWAECLVMLTGVIILAVSVEYVYTFIVLSINNKSNGKGQHFDSQKIENNRMLREINFH